MRIAILDDYQDCVRTLDCFARLTGHDVVVFNDTVRDLDALASRLCDREAVVLIRERTAIGAPLLDRLPRLRLISQTGKVADHLDLAACAAHGVAVADGRGSGAATAELAWALILASRRHLIAEANRLRAGQWQGSLGQELRGQRLGIWGYGRIGRQVAGFGKAFGMQVSVWGREASFAAAGKDGFDVAASRQELFETSDVLSLQVRLNAATRGIVGPDDLQRMKPTALIVNTGRAELIEAGALVEALARGRPGFAAVDVYEQEPVLGAAHPLLAMPNALCTPHIGYVERDNYETYFGIAFDNINAFAAGRPMNIVAPGIDR